MRLRWSQAARRDFAEARAWIAEANPDAARAWAGRIRRSLERIQGFPQAGEPLGETAMHATTVPGTSYRIVYTIQPDAVLIIAIWHGAREWPFD